MAIASREIQIDYGSTQIGGAGGTRPIHGAILYQSETGQVVLDCQFYIKQTSAANFTSEADTVEEGFRKINQAVTVTVGGSTMHSWSHTSNTGFSSVAQLRKVPSAANSARSQMYALTISLGLPADTNNSSGRKSSTVEIAYGENRRRTVTISGEYTALSSNSARDQYEASIAAFATAVLNAIDNSASWELRREPSVQNADSSVDAADDTEGKIVTFRRVYDELIFSQAGASNNDTDIVGQSFRLRRRREVAAHDPSKFVRRRELVTVDYSCWIDKEQSQALETKWENTIKSWALSQIQSRFSLGALKLNSAQPSYDYDENRVDAVMEVDGTPRGSYIEYALAFRMAYNTGTVLVPVWSVSRFSKLSEPGPSSVVVVITETARYAGDRTISPFITPNLPPTFIRQQLEEWELISNIASPRKVREGQDGYRQTDTVWELVTTWEGFNPAQPGQGFVATGEGDGINLRIGG